MNSHSHSPSASAVADLVLASPVDCRPITTAMFLFTVASTAISARRGTLALRMSWRKHRWCAPQNWPMRRRAFLSSPMFAYTASKTRSSRNQKEQERSYIVFMAGLSGMVASSNSAPL